MDDMDKITAIYIIIGCITLFGIMIIAGWIYGSIKDRCKKEWRLGAKSDGQPILEREDKRHREYIYINKENLPLIEHITHLTNPPRLTIPYPYNERERREEEADSYNMLLNMLQDMVNRGHGKWTGFEKEEADCQTCEHKNHPAPPKGEWYYGWCYMFKKKPEGCSKHTPLEIKEAPDPEDPWDDAYTDSLIDEDKF